MTQTICTCPSGGGYRLLERGIDRIEAADEFLKEDGVTWATDSSGIFVGMIYMGDLLLPARRPLATISNELAATQPAASQAWDEGFKAGRSWNREVGSFWRENEYGSPPKEPANPYTPPQPVEPAVSQGDALRSDLIADLHEVFDTKCSETPQMVRDVIEYADSWLQVYIQKRAESSSAQLQEAAPFQQRVQPWMMECFGPMIAGDREERNHRFLEEALELVQATGCSASEAHQLVDYVFGRPVGESAQEVGGVMVTLAALCLANGLNMHEAGETELIRISDPEMTAKIRAKQAAKPKHSPLPAPSHDARSFPDMTPELASILGLMCFQCISFAQALRAGGHQIQTRAEDEQAAVLHWMLSHYFRHGEDWRKAAAEDMENMQAAARTQAKEAGE